MPYETENQDSDFLLGPEDVGQPRDTGAHVCCRVCSGLVYYEYRGGAIKLSGGASREVRNIATLGEEERVSYAY